SHSHALKERPRGRPLGSGQQVQSFGTLLPAAQDVLIGPQLLHGPSCSTCCADMRFRSNPHFHNHTGSRLPGSRVYYAWPSPNAQEGSSGRQIPWVTAKGGPRMKLLHSCSLAACVLLIGAGPGSHSARAADRQEPSKVKPYERPLNFNAKQIAT